MPGTCTDECKSCVGCSCECTSECCADSDCDQANCYHCVDCHCQYKCDPNTEVCCDGVCTPKCEEVGSETLCGSENNIPCPGCVGILGDCSNYKARFYTNEIIYNCSGGCPGDCDGEYPAPPCYDIYYCNNYIHYTYAECRPPIPPAPPGPIDCYETGPGMPWGCTRCQQGDYYLTMDVLSRICQ